MNSRYDGLGCSEDQKVVEMWLKNGRKMVEKWSKNGSDGRGWQVTEQ
jgi:hypothetical protein